MKPFLFALLVFSQTFSQTIIDPISISLTGGGYLFSGFGRDGFSDKSTPRGFQEFYRGAEFKFNKLALSVATTYSDNKVWRPSLNTKYFFDGNDNTSFLSFTWTHKWTQEKEFNNYKNLINLDVGYRLESENFMLQYTVGIAKGLGSDRVAYVMPTSGITIFFVVYRNNENVEKRFRF